MSWLTIAFTLSPFALALVISHITKPTNHQQGATE